MSHPPTNSEAEIVELIRSIDEPAPERLHRHVAEMTTRGRAGHRSGGLSGLMGAVPLSLRFGAAATVLAVALVAVVVALSSGGGASGSGPSLKDETAITLRAATLPAPAENATVSDELNASVDGVVFPYWGERFDWKTSGARRDTVGGRTVETVFYSAPGGKRIGYAIVAGAATSAKGGSVSWRGETPYRLLDEDGVSVVTWVRDGHRCVLSGRGVSGAVLLKLASWDEDAPTAS
jgi:hypothetical protein